MVENVITLKVIIHRSFALLEGWLWNSRGLVTELRAAAAAAAARLNTADSTWKLFTSAAVRHQMAITLLCNYLIDVVKSCALDLVIFASLPSHYFTASWQRGGEKLIGTETSPGAESAAL